MSKQTGQKSMGPDELYSWVLSCHAHLQEGQEGRSREQDQSTSPQFLEGDVSLCLFSSPCLLGLCVASVGAFGGRCCSSLLGVQADWLSSISPFWMLVDFSNRCSCACSLVHCFPLKKPYCVTLVFSTLLCLYMYPLILFFFCLPDLLWIPAPWLTEQLQ